MTIELHMPRPTTIPDRWWIDEAWWTTNAATVEEAYERWSFNHGWRIARAQTSSKETT